MMAALSVGMRAIVHGTCDRRQLLYGVKAEGFELLLRNWVGEPVEEVARELLLLAGFEDDGGLLDGWVIAGRNADEGAESAEVLAAGDGERDEGGLRVAGFGELRGLGYVFGDREFGLEL